MTELYMPSPAEGIDEAVIARWLREEGESVAAGDDLVEIETDKVTMVHPAEASGVLQIVAPEGSAVAVGGVIARVVEPDAAHTARPPVATALRDASPENPPDREFPQPAAARNEGEPRITNGVRATPLARLIARREGIDLAAITGTGPYGLITRADLADPSDNAPLPSRRPTRPTAPGDGTPPPGARASRTENMSRLQTVIAQRMAEAKSTIPDFQVQTEATVDALLALRTELKELGDVTAPSLNDFVIKAAALALRRHPRVNASFQEDHFLLHQSVHVGFAVAATDALVVPTVRDADKRSLLEIAAETRRLAERVRAGIITAEEITGGTFTVSNLGMYGMTAITPIIHAPQAAILGVAAAREQPYLAADGSVRPRSLITLTLSCDHRILYGADAAEFLSSVRTLLEQPLRLTIDADPPAAT